MNIIFLKLSNKNIINIYNKWDIWKYLILFSENIEFLEIKEKKSLINKNSGIFNIKKFKLEISKKFWDLNIFINII